jgi:uncharacterized membrane protein
MIKDDSIIFGIIALLIAIINSISESERPALKKFFAFFPSILLVYLLPALGTTLGLFDISHSTLYQFNIDHLLPACLILMTLSLDIKSLKQLGPKCLAIFLAGTTGVILGGPISLMIVKFFIPESVPTDAWKVLSTLAGSWIGGGVNQAAMKEVFQVEETIFVTSVAVDIVVGAFFWMSTMLFLANKNKTINKWLNADDSFIQKLNFSSNIDKTQASFKDYCWMIGIAFGGTAIARSVALPLVDWIKLQAPELEKYNLTSVFFWVTIFASFIGIFSSLTSLRNLEAKGASKIGNVLLYLLVASIGLKINLSEIWTSPVFFLIGFIWILFHGFFIFLVARLLKAPLFFVAVGSQANIGAAASAPIVASAFASHLAPVGVILAILGYVLGNYGAYICALLMQKI